MPWQLQVVEGQLQWQWNKIYTAKNQKQKDAPWQLRVERPVKIDNIKGEDSRKEYAMTVESRVEGQWTWKIRLYIRQGRQKKMRHDSWE